MPCKSLFIYERYLFLSVPVNEYSYEYSEFVTIFTYINTLNIMSRLPFLQLSALTCLNQGPQWFQTLPLETNWHWLLWHRLSATDSSIAPFILSNSFIRVYNIEGLRVADSSIMPFIPTAPPMAATMMIAEKAADMIKEDWGYQVTPPESLWVYSHSSWKPLSLQSLLLKASKTTVTPPESL